MFLFKTSGATIDSVVKHQKHASHGQPRDWYSGETVLVSKNLVDCKKGERQIQYVMEFEDIRPMQPGESERYWPGTEGRWPYLVLCRNTKKIALPFNLKEALGLSSREYGPIMTFKRLTPDHETQLRAFLKHREPDLLA